MEAEQVATVLHDKGFDVKLLLGDQLRAQQVNAREPTARATAANAKGR